jgi:hypothetical protein
MPSRHSNPYNASVVVSASPPTKVQGRLWLDTNVNLVKIWTGSAWLVLPDDSNLFHVTDELEFSGLLNQATTLANNDTFLLEDEDHPTLAGSKSYITWSDFKGQVDHDAAANYVANEHIDHTSVNIDTTAPLTGGGDISSTRTLDIDIEAVSETSVVNSVDDKLLMRDASDGNNHWIRARLLQSSIVRVRNLTGSNIATGKLLHIDGYDASQNFPTVVLADNSTGKPAHGIANAGINNGNAGDIMISGYIGSAGPDTTAFTAGDTLYLGTSGDMVNSPPTTGFVQQVGVAARIATVFSGRLYVNIQEPRTPQLRTVVTKTGAYTLTDYDDVVLGDATSAAFTLTLPAAASNTGLEYSIKKIDSSANAVTIDGNASETIDDSTTRVLSSQYDSVTIVSDGTEWWIV